jgi:hypothetical protein
VSAYSAQKITASLQQLFISPISAFAVMILAHCGSHGHSCADVLLHLAPVLSTTPICRLPFRP